MSGFAANWLALREPYDAAARTAALIEPLRLALPSGRPIRILDLGCGTGASLRWLAPRLAGDQAWLLVDHDDALLATILDHLRGWANGRGVRLRPRDASVAWDDAAGHIVARWRRHDLRAGLPQDDAAPVDLVTASALLDLLSGAAADRLIDACVVLRAAVYLALTYDGAVAWDPPDPFDDAAGLALNRHQRSDKGLGPALGPDAAAHVAARLRSAGYAVRHAASDWRFTPTDAAIQRALLADWSDAIVQAAPQHAADVAGWAARRTALIESGRSRLRVGHVDLLATPPGAYRPASG